MKRRAKQFPIPLQARVELPIKGLKFQALALDLVRKQLLEAFKLIGMKLSVLPPLEIGGHGVEN